MSQILAAGAARISRPRASSASRSRERLAENVALVLIIAISSVLSAFWAWRVPIFEEPDESAHFDYAISIATTGHLVLPRDGALSTQSSPYTRYLEDVSNFRGTHYNPEGRPPSGYGSVNYFQEVDAGAKRLPANGSTERTVPFLARFYPFGFYAVEAAVMSVAARLSGGSIVAMFFAARFFCVLLLPVGLLLSNAIMVELKLTPWRRLALLLAIGTLPLTSWVFAYIQPDNLVFVLSSLAIYLGLKASRAIDSDRTWITLGVVLAVEFATKVQYFIATALPVFVWLLICARAGRVSGPSLVRKLAYFIFPIVVSGSLSLYVAHAPKQIGPLSSSTLGSDFSRAASHGGVAALSYLWAQLYRAYLTNFGLGMGLVSYWGSISWLMTPIQFISPTLTLLTFTVISVLTTIVAALMVYRQCGVAARLYIVARRRSVFTAVRVAGGNLVLNTYLLYILLMLTLSILTNGEVIKQGRYFLTFVVASTLCATTYAPQVLPFRFRNAFGATLVVLLCTYSVVSSAFGLQALQRRFYVAPKKVSAYERLLHVGFCADPGSEMTNEQIVTVAQSSPVAVCGWALDAFTGGPSRAVMVEIDGSRLVPITYGLPRADVVESLLDDRFLNSGFRVLLPTADMSLGIHSVRFVSVERNRRAYGVATIRVRVIE